MAQNYYDAFIAKLQEIFMMDHAELDFGIYRIMNQKRHDIDVFLKTKLLPQVQADLSGAANSDAEADRKRMAEILQQLGTDNIETQRASTMPLIAQVVDEYDRLQAKLANSSDMEALQAQVFSHLVTFFSRYYEGGDFISKRRYKENTYAIPYNGEEVKLHWANSDQYYIKTSEYFRDYTFVLPNSRRKVHFILRDATTEQNNNKAQNNMERRFALWKPSPQADEVTTPLAIRRGAGGEAELDIFFTYELMPKATKQDGLMKEAFNTISPLVPEDFKELLTIKQPTKKEPNRTLLEKHLTDYTAKNSFDYFIHKDLGTFLRREMDFYIKNEVLHIDDLDPAFVISQLTIVKAIKNVGEKIIRMLAQLEDFQKRLWLKKKFVLQSDYCITLDRVPESLYPAIIENEAQRKEWVRLFAIDEIKGNGMFTHGYSEPLTIEFLKENPFLVLDTAFFDAGFKHKLVKSMENIDEQTNGLLINSENFQALELLQEKYKERVKCVYIDPPYNTGKDGFCYKDRFQHSSWLTFIFNRLILCYNLLRYDSVFFTSISDQECYSLGTLLRDVFDETNFEGHIHWRRRHNQPNDRTKMLGLVAEHILSYARDSSFYKQSGVGKIEVTGNFNNPDNDPRGPWASKPWKVGTDQSGSRYVIIGPNGKRYEEEWMGEEETFRELLREGRMYFPKGGDGLPRKKYYKSEREEEGQCATNWWPHDQFGHNQGASDMLANMMGTKNTFSNPKPVSLIKSLYDVANVKDDDFVLDFFVGSGTSYHSSVQLNRERINSRCIAVEVNEYFNSITKPRIEKAIYSEDWREGKPISRSGISHCFKYIRLEQYEDTLNNLQLKVQQTTTSSGPFHESYMLGYWLDTETRESLLNLKWFENPFAMTLKATRDNELVETPVDMVETFNFLIGLNVETESWYKDDNICVLTGRTHREGLKTLIIWRNCKEIDNKALDAFFDRMDFRTRDSEFDLIYVNGDNTLPNLRRDEEHWKVMLIEEEFQNRMFTEE
jgi:adenine-specific DNA-methyltransferase